MTADSQFDMWDRFVVGWAGKPLWRQIASELGGRLVMLDRDSHETCEEISEVSVRPREPWVRCELAAILIDRIRGRRQCFGHATMSAEFRDLNIDHPVLETQ